MRYDYGVVGQGKESRCHSATVSTVGFFFLVLILGCLEDSRGEATIGWPDDTENFAIEGKG